MALDAVVSVIIQKLRDVVAEEPITYNKVIGTQLKEMQDELEKMQGFFIDAADKETNVDAIKKWTDDYLQNLYEVEDAIESFALRITRQRKRMGFLMNHALFLKNFTACKMLSRKLKKIQRKIVSLEQKKPDDVENASLRSNRSHQNYEENDAQIDSSGAVSFSRWTLGEIHEEEKTNTYDYALSDDITPSAEHSMSTSSFTKYRKLSSKDSIIRERWEQGKLMFGSFSDEQELYNVGFKQDVHDLVKRLTGEDNGDNRIISLVGEMGSGKTTLARAVYENRITKDHFNPLRAWITISKDSSTEDVLLNLLKQVGESKDQDGVHGEQTLRTIVCKRLKDRKYLIVLDGVWSSESSEGWENLKIPFPDKKNGSKIILTTRDEQRAKNAFPKSPPYYMKKLDDQDSWKLFLHKVGEERNECSTLKKKIIKICNGLPMNIILLGSLSSKNNPTEWVPILDSQENGHTLDILSLCYNDLDAHSKLCLLYLTLFPQEYNIPIRRLLRLWLAEGFVKLPEEDEVQKCFDNLVIRSLIQISKLRSDGSPRKCRLLGVLRDYLVDKARDISLFHVHRNSACQVSASFFERRLVESADAKNCSLNPSQSRNPSQFQHWRSYISFNFQKKDIPAIGVRNLLRDMICKGFGLLRVLDLEGVYKPSLPDNLGDLFHLRYLGLRWTFLDKIPKSVGDLPYLETLDLKHTYINRIPSSIWKLKHLRHLNLNEISLDKDMPLHQSDSLPPLLTLWGLSVDPESPVKNCLSKLDQLRELGISFRWNNLDDHLNQATNGSRNFSKPIEELLKWISQLTTLQSLRLRSKDDSGRPSELSLKPLSALVKLTNLNLLGKLQKLPELDQFPPNIKVLTLSVSQLLYDPMPILGKLPGLTVLRLLANSYKGDKIVCPQETFTELRVLSLWMLKDLKEWELEEGAMEKLKELNIRYCSNLHSIPSRLLQQRELNLILTNMPPKFKENVEKNSSKVSITVKDYKFTSLPWELEDVSSNEVASKVNGETSHI
ncbi:unnamed protein product [Fraxinus pennsylvanica]|uniref:Uncharacterized protein n=1 Tax=Fraxinus pennsylvanica TaxID=56036 RepID=A0AAD1Z4X0_9LAMI|nr:unnamed protein product [Fraxinus pennsylvanica]